MRKHLYIARNVGSMYTPLLYGGGISYLIGKWPEELIGKEFALFSGS